LNGPPWRCAPPLLGGDCLKRHLLISISAETQTQCAAQVAARTYFGQFCDAGGVDATSRRGREASFNGADGVVGNGTPSIQRILKHFGNPNHPVCAAAVASHLFLDGAATPPASGGELPASHSLTPSLTALALRSGTPPVPGGEFTHSIRLQVATLWRLSVSLFG
jgi:hypothetical protein